MDCRHPVPDGVCPPGVPVSGRAPPQGELRSLGCPARELLCGLQHASRQHMALVCPFLSAAVNFIKGQNMALVCPFQSTAVNFIKGQSMALVCPFQSTAVNFILDNYSITHVM